MLGERWWRPTPVAPPRACPAPLGHVTAAPGARSSRTTLAHLLGAPCFKNPRAVPRGNACPRKRQPLLERERGTCPADRFAHAGRTSALGGGHSSPAYTG